MTTCRSIGLQWMLIAQSALSDSEGQRARAHPVREQGAAHARRRLRLAHRAGRHRQGLLHRRASRRRAVLQRRHQVVPRALQRTDLCRPRCAKHHRLDLRRPLHGLHARRAGEGRRTGGLAARNRREDRGHEDDRGAGRTAGAVRGDPQAGRRGTARRHRLGRRPRHLPPRLRVRPRHAAIASRGADAAGRPRRERCRGRQGRFLRNGPDPSAASVRNVSANPRAVTQLCERNCTNFGIAGPPIPFVPAVMNLI